MMRSISGKEAADIRLRVSRILAPSGISFNTLPQPVMEKRRPRAMAISKGDLIRFLRRKGMLLCFAAFFWSLTVVR